MQKQIRSSVFETNSSSSHSLTLGKSSLQPLIATEDELKTGTVIIHLGEYGWEWARLYSCRNKMSYLATQVKSQYDTHSDAAFNEAISDGPLQMLKDLVLQLTGCQTKFIGVDNSYIDHQSYARGVHLFDNMDELKAFLLDETAYIQTGNDNEEPPIQIFSDVANTSEWYGQPWRLPTTPRGAIFTVSLHRIGHACSILKTSDGQVLGAFTPELEALLVELCAAPIKTFNYTKISGRSSYLRGSINPVKASMEDLKRVFSCFGRAENQPRTKFAKAIQINCHQVNVSDDEYFEQYSTAAREYSFIVRPTLLEKLNALPKLTKQQFKIVEAYALYLVYTLNERLYDAEDIAEAKKKLKKLLSRKTSMPAGLECISV